MGLGQSGTRGEVRAPSAAPPPVPFDAAPASLRPPQSATPASLRKPDPPSTQHVLRMRELAVSRVFYQAMVAITAIATAAMPFLPGPAWLRAATAALGIAAMAVLVVGLELLKRPERYTRGAQNAIGVLCVTLGVAFVYYLGLYSASATIFTVGIYFFASTLDRRGARLVCGLCAGIYLVITAAIAADVVPDLSLFSVKDVPHLSRWYRVAIQQVMYALTFLMARNSRRSTEAAIERIQSADREIAQRDAQLEEARGELDRALHAGEGRYTGELMGNYRLGPILGRGGMGEVYEARHVDTDHVVAIKLLYPNMLEHADHVERFVREARAASQVPNPYVAAVYEVGTTPAGAPFIVMEKLDGHDLGYYLRKTPTLAIGQVVEMVEHCARALSAVREAGVVHRDLKPANLFLTDSLPRTWKVLDFGLSKIHGTEGITKDQAVGTPAYMAPEQVRGGEVDHLADLYGLAAIAYRAITGRPPFVGEQIAPVLMDVIRRMPANPGELVKLPVEVELVLAIGLAKRKEDRFPSVEELAAAFALAARGELDDATRARGWALVKQYPWGSKVGSSRR